MSSYPTDSVLVEKLRERGQRVTSQRVVIHRLITERDQHLTAEQVHDAVADRLPGTSLPTVYATLELLESIGLVHRVATERGAVIYDPRTDQHHHLACRRCGAIVDVEGAVDAEALLAAARSTGFAPDQAQVVVRGLCADCA